MKPKNYRDIIDHLVRVCKEGQGQIGARRARAGLWNMNATKDFLQDQHRINVFLSELTSEQREILAGMLEQVFIGGVFESLKALEEFEIEPFLDGYEGSPYHDFIGRVDDDPWEWPVE
jgi:hypothetical protein